MYMLKYLWPLVRVAVLCAALLVSPACDDDASKVTTDLEQARTAFSNGLYLQAESSFETFLQNNPVHPARWEAYNRLVDISLSVKGDPARGLELLETMLPEFMADQDRAADILLRMGDLHRAAGRVDQAMTVWRKAWALPDVSAQALAPFNLRLARAMRAKGQYQASRDVLERCRISVKDAAVQRSCEYELALTSTLMEDNARAEELLERLLNRPDLDGEERGVAAFLLADIYMQNKRYGEARELLESIRPVHPNPLAVDARLEQLKGK